MKKKIKVYFSPVIVEVEIDEKLNKEEAEQEINRQVYDVQVDDITNETVIDYWEE